MRSFVVPFPLPTVAGEIEANWNVILLAAAIDVIDAQPTEFVISCDCPLIVGRSLHDWERTPQR